MSQLQLVSERAYIRVLDTAGDLALLADGPMARMLLATGCYRSLRRGKKLRALIPIASEEECAAVIRDANQLEHDRGIAVRPGYSHRLETSDNPRGVITISRIPASLRPHFTAVVDQCAA